MNIIPPYLKKGSTIGICSVAKSITRERIAPTVKMLEEAGFNLVIGNTIGLIHYQYAGSDEQRTIELQQMLDDDSIDAILFARGGYGTIRIVDKINYRKFKKKPKWLCGFSDITVLHGQIQRLGIASMHSLMCSTHDQSITPDLPFNSLIKGLRGKKNVYQISMNKCNKGKGNVKGEIVGGNLSILCALNASKSMPHTVDKILFIEDLMEYLYRIDRMMYNLKRSNKLAGLKALLVGSFTDIEDNEIPFGKSIEEIILDAVVDYNFPVIFGMPSGHQGDNRAIKLGMHCELKQQKDKIIFIQ